MAESTSQTPSKIIDGKQCAGQLRERVKQAVDRLQAQHSVCPGLAVVLIGEDPASQIYVRNKIRFTEEVGMRSFEHRLTSETSEAELLELIDSLNKDPAVHGILVQLPLPDAIREQAVLEAIDPSKDVDGFHVENAGLLATGQPALVPCTPLGCKLLIQETIADTSGLHAVVVGRSNIVGKPMAQLLLGMNCTVTIAHSRTRDLGSVCSSADILVAAVGRPKMIQGNWVKAGSTVIDVGINRIDVNGKSRLVGDVDFESVSPIAGAITPVPGGVGPMTIACLLRNTVEAACRQKSIAFAFEGL